jgi:hypothetical protein
MRALFVFLILLMTVGIGQPGLASLKPRILPFKVWKQKKIDEAKAVVLELKHDHRKQTQVKSSEDGGDEPQDEAQKLSQAELNLGLTRELSANDYFLLYVSPQFKGNTEALAQAAKTLSPRDIADILSAYEKKLQASDSYNGSDAPATPADESPQTEKTAKAP